MTKSSAAATHPHINTPESSQYCYHCKDSVPADGALSVWVAGKTRVVCCSRCQAAAQWIEAMGLSDFYQLRTARPPQRLAAEEHNGAWATPAIKAQVLRDKGQGIAEVSLLIEGMHCSGCVWLIERLLLKLGGVSNIQINPVTHRAVLSFDRNKVSLNDILRTLNKAGYQPRPLESANLDDARTKESRDLLKRLFVAGLGMMQVMTYAFVLYWGHFEPLPKETSELFRWLGFFVSTPVVFYAALPFFRNARHALTMRSLNMDVPIAIAIAAVYGSSVYQSLMMQGEVYFESVTMLVFFLLTGRYVEMRARHHAIDNADALIHLTPSYAQRRKADGSLESVPVSDLCPGDTVQIAEGAHVPADGILLSQQTRLDEALLSGEAVARQRVQNDALIAGSLVLEGPIDMQVTRVGAETFLASLANLSTHAQTQRPRLSRRGEKATANFVLRVLVLTVLTLGLWLWFDKSQALEATIALLVVACPCALGLAAPAAITRALGILAQRNILVVRPDAIETLNTIDTVVFDKTGTLSEVVLNSATTDAAVLQLAASLARESQHPLSRALVAANTQKVFAVENAQAFLGLGIEGTVAGRVLRLGQARFALNETLATQYSDASLVLGEDGKLLASFHMDEKLRADAKSTVNYLHKQAINSQIVSGDSEPRVAKVAQQLGINSYSSRQLPADKLAQLKQLQAAGHCVMVVGDGSNDAPVLAGADVSIALSSGTELAQANADILICDGRLASLIDAKHIARQTQKILQQNERWAMAYNTIAMPVAALGYIPPWLAAIFMSLSSLFVVMNALRIGKSYQKRQTAQSEQVRV